MANREPPPWERRSLAEALPQSEVNRLATAIEAAFAPDDRRSDAPLTTEVLRRARDELLHGADPVPVTLGYGGINGQTLPRRQKRALKKGAACEKGHARLLTDSETQNGFFLGRCKTQGCNALVTWTGPEEKNTPSREMESEIRVDVDSWDDDDDY